MDNKDHKQEIVFVHPGDEAARPESSKCEDDCVGGTASTENMKATYPE